MKQPKTGLFIGKGKDGQWYWHLKAKNGKITAGDEGHNSKQSVVKSIKSTAMFFCGPVYMLWVFDLTTKKTINL